MNEQMKLWKEHRLWAMRITDWVLSTPEQRKIRRAGFDGMIETHQAYEEIWRDDIDSDKEGLRWGRLV